MLPTKVCSTCRELKAGEDFNAQKGTPGGRRSQCKSCHQSEARQHQWLHRWGIVFSDEQYDAMHAAQKGRCALCGRPETVAGKSGKTRRMPLDHDDQTKMVRALLCSACNTGIGNLQHDPTLLRKAAKYILDHRKRHAQATKAGPVKSLKSPRRKGV